MSAGNQRSEERKALDAKIKAAFEEHFPVGRQFETSDVAKLFAREIAEPLGFVVNREGMSLRCSRGVGGEKAAKKGDWNRIGCPFKISLSLVNRPKTVGGKKVEEIAAGHKLSPPPVPDNTNKKKNTDENSNNNNNKKKKTRKKKTSEPVDPKYLICKVTKSCNFQHCLQCEPIEPKVTTTENIVEPARKRNKRKQDLGSVSKKRYKKKRDSDSVLTHMIPISIESNHSARLGKKNCENGKTVVTAENPCTTEKVNNGGSSNDDNHQHKALGQCAKIHEVIQDWLTTTSIGSPDSQQMEEYAKKFVDLGLDSVEMIQRFATKEHVNLFDWMKSFHKLVFLENQ